MRMPTMFTWTCKWATPFYCPIKVKTLQEFQDTLAGTINWTRYVQSVMPAEVLLKRFPNGLSAAEARISEVQLIKVGIFAMQLII